MSEQQMSYEQIDRRLTDLRQDLGRSFAAIDQRFAAIDRRFAAIDQRFGAIDQRFAAVDQRFSAIDQKLMWIIGLIVATWTTTILTIIFHR